MARQPTRDPAEITAERLAEAQNACLATIRRELAAMGFARMPQSIVIAVRDCANACERIGEHHAGLRRTVPHTPPDPDRAPFDDELTPVVGPEGRRRRALRNQK